MPGLECLDLALAPRSCRFMSLKVELTKRRKVNDRGRTEAGCVMAPNGYEEFRHTHQGFLRRKLSHQAVPQQSLMAHARIMSRRHRPSHPKAGVTQERK